MKSSLSHSAVNSNVKNIFLKIDKKSQFIFRPITSKLCYTFINMLLGQMYGALEVE